MRPSLIVDQHNLAIFDLQVTPMLPTKFGVHWPFGSEEQAENRFSIRLSWRPSWISERNDFSYFLSTSHPDVSYLVSSQLAFAFRRRSGHLGFPISTILAVFDLQVTPMLPTKFGVNWPFGSEEEAKNIFSRWRPWRPSWISDRHDFNYFDLHVTPMFPTKYRVNWPRSVGE